MAGEIFISYRRNGSGYTRALHGALSERFGDERLFMDVDTIEPGVDFARRIERALAHCKALVAVIGEDWLEVVDEQGKRRLDDEHDYVRIEIAAALERDIPVIPVLLGNASMPRAAALPDPLKALSRRNAVTLPHEHFQAGVERLVGALSKYVPLVTSVVGEGPATEKRTGMSTPVKVAWIGALGVILAALIGAAVTLLRSSTNEAALPSPEAEVAAGRDIRARDITVTNEKQDAAASGGGVAAGRDIEARDIDVNTR